MSASHIPEVLRRYVSDRADGRCEYCLIPEFAVLVSHEADHIVARKHGGTTEAANLALSCRICNKHKGSDLTSIDPETGLVTLLYNPRRDRWQEHFYLAADGCIVPLTSAGRVTVRLLQLNVPARMEERQLLLEFGDLRIPD